jgi:hypothetical protein
MVMLIIVIVIVVVAVGIIAIGGVTGGVTAARGTPRPRGGRRLVVGAVTTVGRGTSKTDAVDWLAYHRAVGVGRFYVFYDGGEKSFSESASTAGTTEDEETFRAAVGNVDDVVFYGSEMARKSRERFDYLRQKPFLAPYVGTNGTCGASALFVRQTLHLESAIENAQTSGDVDWLVHIDADELIAPFSSHGFSVESLFASLPSNVGRVVMPNHEAVPESAFEKEACSPFRTVTLFRKNHRRVHPTVYRKFAHLARRGVNPNYFLAYANGKSAARVTKSLRANGAHRFKCSGVEITCDECAVLHYPFSSVRRAAARLGRCDCDAKGESTDKCSFLSFDREMAEFSGDADAFEKWFVERIVETNITRRRDLLSAGVYERILTGTFVLRRVAPFEACDEALKNDT